MLIKSQNEKIIVNMNNVAAIELIDTIRDENGNEIPSKNLFAIGVSTTNGRDFVMADLPGIIEGAHQGAGLGLQFLRHIERCRVIVHIIDMAATDGRDPYEDYVAINNELKEYKMNLSKRPMILVANKKSSSYYIGTREIQDTNKIDTVNLSTYL